MLIPSEKQLKARRALLAKVQTGRGDREQTMQRLLELDPDDARARIELAEIRKEAGDIEEAERYYWAGLEMQPCAIPGYLGLASMYLATNVPLSRGLIELGMRKMALQPKLARELAKTQPEFLEDIDEIASGLAPEEKMAVVAEALHHFTEDEPREIAKRLQPYRLIHEMQEADELDPSVVDDFLAEGRAMVPLLVGVLRGWGWMEMDPEEEETVERALALLGEVGGPDVIPHLAGFVGEESNTLSQAAIWAWDRIIEANPEEARQAMAQLAESADVAIRIAIAERLFQHRDLDRGGIVERLSIPGDYSDADADALAAILIAVTIGTHGKRGVPQARSIVQRLRRLMSRGSLRILESLIADAVAGAMPELPDDERDPPTIYEICAGMADWDDPEDEEAFDDEEDEPGWKSEPALRPRLPDRNDPCWCGSGKKYKKCHLDADQSGGAEMVSTGGQFNALRRRLGEFMGEIVDAADGKRALRQYWGDDDGKPDNMALVDWMIHDRILPGLQRNVMQEFLHRHGHTISRRERELVESWSQSYIGLYEVQSVRQGTGFEVKDLLGDPEPFFVHDVSLSKHLVAWDGLMARVVEGERGTEITGVGVTIPRAQLETLREWLHEDRKETGLPWRDYLKRRHPDIRRQPGIIANQWAESLRLVNTDGEELLFSKAVYEVTDGKEVEAALRASPGLLLEEDDPGVFRLLSENNTLLVTFRVEGESLTVEANSRERLEMAKATLARLGIQGLSHVRDELTTQQEMKRRAMSGTAPKRQKRELPPEDLAIVEEHLEEHYEKWPDTKLPALDGKTPRQAAKTRAGRKKLAEVLKTLENNEERKRRAGEPYYDARRLRRVLGVYE